MEIKHYSPNRHKHFKSNALRCIQAMNITAHLMGPVSPPAYALSTYLASWWNNSTANAAINPTDERVFASLNITPEQRADAMAELEAKGWWSAVWDGDRVTEYKPLFALDPAKAAGLRADVQERHRGFSMNHAKAVVRYLRSDNVDATAIMLWAVANIRQRAIRMGDRFYQSAVPGQKSVGKLFHGVFFNHPRLSQDSPADWESVARVVNLPEDWANSNPSSVSVSRKRIGRTVFMSQARYDAALASIEEEGFWAVERQEDMDILTPTFRLHALVWEFDRYCGGKSISEWESERGLGDPAGLKKPKAGYHYIYGLVSRKTGDYILVGQTTQALPSRRNQHLHLASNAEANEAVRKILRDPENTVDIKKLAEVSYARVAEVEMMLANILRELGHPIENKLLTVLENRSTIKLDKRFGRYAKAEHADTGGPAIIDSMWPPGHLEAWLEAWMPATDGGHKPFGGQEALDAVIEANFNRGPNGVPEAGAAPGVPPGAVLDAPPEAVPI